MSRGCRAINRRQFLKNASQAALALPASQLIWPTSALAYGPKGTFLKNTSKPGATWQPVSASGLSPREGHSAIWTGSQIIIWGGRNGATYYNDGAMYNPATDTWTAMTNTAAPSIRTFHTAIWTGTQMIVWGGFNGSYINTGGIYNPSLNTWTSATSSTGVPGGRAYHTALWSGTHMIIWGGYNGTSSLANGGLYDPVVAASSAWTSPTMSTAGSGGARQNHSAIWTGTQMIIYGGLNGATVLNSGARFTLATNVWSTMATGPLARRSHTAVYDGSNMYVWGGSGTSIDYGTGDIYNIGADFWAGDIPSTSLSPRFDHTALWTGTNMLVWGGRFSTGTSRANSGAIYSPANASQSWMNIPTVGAPVGRSGHTAVWTGSKMMVWGGHDGTTVRNDGGLFTP